MSAGRLACRFVAVAVLAVVFSTTGQGASGRSRQLPFDLQDGADIVVPVMVDGRGPFRFLLDTGSSRTVLSSTLAESLGVVPIARTVLLTPSGRAGHPIGVVRRVEVGAAPPTNVLAMIVPDANLPQGRRVDGIVGQDVLAALTYTIDYVNRHIVWHVAPPPNLVGERLRLLRSDRGVLVTLPQPTTGDLHFVPDSGADGWVLFGATGQQLLVTRPLGSASLRTVAGEHAARGVLIDELIVGAMRFRDQPAVLVDRDPHDRSLGDGLLPLHLFARVTFNPREQQLIVEGK